MSVEARDAVLARIGSGLKGRTPESPGANAAEWEALSREYDQRSRLSLEAKLDLLEERLRDFDAEVTRCHDQQVAALVSHMIAVRGGLPTLVPQGFPPRWMPSDALLTMETGFSSREFDHFDGVVTGATVAIAETGSLVLQDVPGQGRRAATLIPDFHLCVVRAADVVETVPEAFLRLQATASLPTTFVSGPSATADIEMTRIKGVHGPRFLHVVLVTG